MTTGLRAPEAHGPPWSRHLVLVILIAICLFAGLLRGWASSQQAYWHDEIYTLGHLTGFDSYLFEDSDLRPIEGFRPAGEFVTAFYEDRYWSTLPRNMVHEGHPPAYSLGLKAWTLIFGSGQPWLRNFSIFAGIATVPILFLLGSAVGSRRTGLVAAAVMATSPFHLYFSVEARPYAWSILFSSVALLAAIRWGRDGAQVFPWWGVWCVAVVGASLTHYYAGLFCAALALAVLVASPRTPGRLVALSVPFLACAPWIPVLLRQIGLHSEQHWTYGAPSLGAAATGYLVNMVDLLSGPYASATHVERVFAVGLATLAAVLLFGSRRPGDRQNAYSLVLVLSIFGGLVLLVDLGTNHHTILVPRYVSSILPPLAVLLSTLIDRPSVLPRMAVCVYLGVALIACVLTGDGRRAPKQMLGHVADYIAGEYDPSRDVVLVTPSGPTLIGVSVYAPPHILIGAAPYADVLPIAQGALRDGRRVWLIRQALGAEYRPPQFNSQLDEFTARYVPFAGLDLLLLEDPSTG